MEQIQLDNLPDVYNALKAKVSQVISVLFHNRIIINDAISCIYNWAHTIQSPLQIQALQYINELFRFSSPFTIMSHVTSTMVRSTIPKIPTLAKENLG